MKLGCRCKTTMKSVNQTIFIGAIQLVLRYASSHILDLILCWLQVAANFTDCGVQSKSCLLPKNTRSALDPAPYANPKNTGHGKRH